MLELFVQNERSGAIRLLDRLDTWFGKGIFHPPIIWVCQRTGTSQYAISRYGWMLAAWTLVMRLNLSGVTSIVLSVLAVLIAGRETFLAAVFPDAPVKPSRLLRQFILVTSLFDVVMLVMASAHHGFRGFGWTHAWDLFALVAEYAKTIDTIPPRRIRERKGSRRDAWA